MMENNLESKQERDLFSELGIEVAEGDIEVGKTYPIFGMITRIEEMEGDQVAVEINKNIIAKMTIKTTDRLDLLKQKAFETGIFVSQVISTEPQIEVECQAVIFGRNQAFNA